VTGHVCSLHGATAASSRSAARDLHAPPDPVQEPVHPGRRVIDPEPPSHQIANPGQSPAPVLVPPRAGARPRVGPDGVGGRRADPGGVPGPGRREGETHVNKPSAGPRRPGLLLVYSPDRLARKWSATGAGRPGGLGPAA
jgi:hypothetical protein